MLQAHIFHAWKKHFWALLCCCLITHTLVGEQIQLSLQQQIQTLTDLHIISQPVCGIDYDEQQDKAGKTTFISKTKQMQTLLQALENEQLCTMLQDVAHNKNVFGTQSQALLQTTYNNIVRYNNSSWFMRWLKNPCTNKLDTKKVLKILAVPAIGTAYVGTALIKNEWNPIRWFEAPHDDVRTNNQQPSILEMLFKRFPSIRQEPKHSHALYKELYAPLINEEKKANKQILKGNSSDVMFFAFNTRMQRKHLKKYCVQNG